MLAITAIIVTRNATVTVPHVMLLLVSVIAQLVQCFHPVLIVRRLLTLLIVNITWKLTHYLHSWVCRTTVRMKFNNWMRSVFEILYKFICTTAVGANRKPFIVNWSSLNSSENKEHSSPFYQDAFAIENCVCWLIWLFWQSVHQVVMVISAWRNVSVRMVLCVMQWMVLVPAQQAGKAHFVSKVSNTSHEIHV